MPPKKRALVFPKSKQRNISKKTTTNKNVRGIRNTSNVLRTNVLIYKEKGYSN